MKKEEYPSQYRIDAPHHTRINRAYHKWFSYLFIDWPPRDKVRRAIERFMSLMFELFKLFGWTDRQLSLGKILDQAMVVVGPNRQCKLEISSLIIVLTSKPFLTEDTEFPPQWIITILGGYSDGVIFRLIVGSTSYQVMPLRVNHRIWQCRFSKPRLTDERLNALRFARKGIDEPIIQYIVNICFICLFPWWNRKVSLAIQDKLRPKCENCATVICCKGGPNNVCIFLNCHKLIHCNRVKYIEWGFIEMYFLSAKTDHCGHFSADDIDKVYGEPLWLFPERLISNLTDNFTSLL
jgi:hypothetical protein